VGTGTFEEGSKMSRHSFFIEVAPKQGKKWRRAQFVSR
jgi:hypothetical protein